MSYAVKKVDVWAGDFVNRPGMLARVLEALTAAGAELDLLIGRQISARTSRIYVAPLKTKKQKDAACEVGLVPAAGMFSLRVEGPDRAGLGAEMARAIAAADVNIRGVTAATFGNKFVCYFGFKTEAELQVAKKALAAALRAKKKR